jgi:hypothetical protein
VVALAILLAACGDSDDDDATNATEGDVNTVEPAEETDAPDKGTAEGADPGTGTTETDPADAALLLNCDGEIGADVPTFYGDYFRCSNISLDGDVVVISSANQPPHLSWYYDDNDELHTTFVSRGDEYYQNPNTIDDASFTLRIPVTPSESGVTIDGNTVNLATGDNTDYKFGIAGVALDSASYFNPLAAPGDDIEDEKYSFDLNEGHPENTGTYHYHAPALGPLTVLQSLGMTTSNIPGSAEIELYGIMCDGTVLFGQTELDGTTVDTDLDEQAGHTHDIVDTAGAALLEDRYHVHMASTIGAEPRGLTPEARYYSTCDVS